MTGVKIDDVHSLAYFIAAKQIAAFPSPNEFNTYANLANIDLFNYYNDERTKMLIKVKAGESLYVPPALANFVKYNITPVVSGGIITQPDDFQYDLEFISSPSPSTQVYIKKVDYDKVTNYINSTIDPPTLNNPIFVELSDSFVVYPSTISNVSLTYLKQPNDVFWNYSLVNNRPVYNPVGSVDYEFDETEIYRLTARVLKYMGISIRDSELAQAAAQMEQEAS